MTYLRLWTVAERFAIETDFLGTRVSSVGDVFFNNF